MRINAVIRGQVLLGLISFQWILSLKELPFLTQNKLPEHEFRMHSNHIQTTAQHLQSLKSWPCGHL